MDSNNMYQNQQNGEQNSGSNQNGYYQNNYTQGDNNQNAYTNTNYQPNPYSNGNYQQYQQPYQQMDTDLEEPVSMGEWAITIILMMIPCVGIIMLFVWAFSSGTKKSKSNFCKVQLIVMAVSLVLSFIFGATMVSAVANMLSNMYY